MATVYEKILYHAITKNIIPKSVMLALVHSFSPIYRAVDRGIELGYLEERTINVESDGKRYKEDFLVITNAGINYFSSLALPGMSWIPSVPEEAKVIGSKVLGSVKVRRYLSIVANAIIAEELGMEVSPIFFDVGAIEGEVLVRDIVLEAYEKREEIADSLQIVNDSYDEEASFENLYVEEEREAISEAPLKFCTALDVKRLVSSSEATQIGYDFGRGKYTGVFFNGEELFVTYTCLKGRFIFTDDESKQNRIVRTTLPRVEEFNTGKKSMKSILLVSSPKIFKSSFFDVDYLKRKKRSLFFSNLDLDEFCVFPITRYGIDSLKEYLLDIDHEQEIVETALRSGRFMRNDRKYSEKIFPLIREDGIPVMIGTKIDIIRLYAVESLSKKNPNDKFGVICYEWQVDYYERTGIGFRLITLSVD